MHFVLKNNQQKCKEGIDLGACWAHRVLAKGSIGTPKYGAFGSWVGSEIAFEKVKCWRAQEWVSG